jgi:hypothetical protein
MLAKEGAPWAELLVARSAGGPSLPVFSGEGEAEMFVWLGGAFDDGWWIRETTAGELISVLYGPCADVGWVALDPSPRMTPDEILAGIVSRKRFLGWLLNDPGSIPQQSYTHSPAGSPVGPA